MMLSITLATSSHLSTAVSITSNISFHLMICTGSFSSSNNCAINVRPIPSLSFSYRLITMQCFSAVAGVSMAKSAENERDQICRTLIAQLFDEEKDPVQIIKWKEIFEVMETAVDKCEDVANVIESIILKSA